METFFVFVIVWKFGPIFRDSHWGPIPGSRSFPVTPSSTIAVGAILEAWIFHSHSALKVIA
jgi:hypothetical protein